MMSKKEILKLSDTLELILKDHDEICTHIVKELIRITDPDGTQDPSVIREVILGHPPGVYPDRLRELVESLENEVGRMSPLFGFIMATNRYIETKTRTHRTMIKQGYALLNSMKQDKSFN